MTYYGNVPAVTEEDKTLGVFCHVLGIVTGFLGPLILWLVKKTAVPTSPITDGRRSISS
jgi:uncharacterized Tic20 family protein